MSDSRNTTNARGRWLLIALIALALLLCAAPAALAQEAAPTQSIGVVENDPSALFQTGGLPIMDTGSGIVSNASAFDSYVAPQLENLSGLIDISSFGLSIDTATQQYRDLLNSRPDLFYVSSGFRYYYNGGTMTKIVPTYLYPAADIPAMKKAFNKEANRIIKFASAATTTLGKLMLVNDYFCTHYQYDRNYEIYDAYNLFTKKIGVCQAYMLGYRHIMNKLGISNKTVTSTDMNHTWNVVRVSGKWYHIDVTWNDPLETYAVNEKPYRSRHQYFMCSNGGLDKHYGWLPTVSANDTQYDAFFWEDVDVSIPVVGDTMYYVYSNSTSQQLRKWVVGTSVMPTLHSFNAKWYQWNNRYSYWPGYHGFVGVYDGRVYFSTTKAVYSVDDDGGDLRLSFMPDTSNGYIYDGYMNGSTVYYTIAKELNTPQSKATQPLPTDQTWLPRSTATIGQSAFQRSALTWFDGGEGLRTIGSRAFANCAALDIVVLGDNVTSIADDAFTGADPVFVCPSGSYAASYANSHGLSVINP